MARRNVIGQPHRLKDLMRTEQKPKAEKKAKSFVPTACYNKAGDFIEVLLEDAAYWASRQNNAITLLLAMDNSRIVGIQVKNVKDLLEGKDPNARPCAF